jgi:RimJ/RimL family protein N-acetyltransferase
MSSTLVRIDPVADRLDLVRFLTSNRFPFHVRQILDAAAADQLIAAGRFDSAESVGFWVMDGEDRVGIAVLEDLQDDTPLFDLRLSEAHRGRGLGFAALTALIEYVFSSMPHVNRFEGHTRDDNVAMRRTFLRAGFAKEAHYRRSWPGVDGETHDSVGYAILRGDWLSGGVTPVNWDDLA